LVIDEALDADMFLGSFPLCPWSRAANTIGTVAIEVYHLMRLAQRNGQMPSRTEIEMT
jgi:hypothetical protein